MRHLFHYVLGLLIVCSTAFAASNDSLIVQAWSLASQNKIPQGIELLERQTKTGDLDLQQHALQDLAIFYRALGNNEAAYGRILESYHRNPNPDALMLSLSNLLSPLRQMDSIVIAQTKAILQDVTLKYPGHPLRWELQAELANTEIGHLPPDSLQQHMNHLGLIRKWRMLGPFENVSQSGMAQTLSPETGGTWSGKIIGKSALPLETRNINNSSADGWLRIDNIQGMENSVNYFATDISAEQARSAQLLFGVSGSFVVWVNGERVLVEKQFRNVGVTGFRVRIHLNKGSNSIVVKIGHEKNFHSNFIVNVADSAGLPLVLAANYPQKIPVLSDRHTALAAVIPEAWIVKNPVGLEQTLQMVEYWIDNDGFEDARPWITKLAKDYPKTGLVQALQGEAYAREENGTLADQQFQLALRLDPALSMSWLYEFNRRVAREDWAGAATWFEHRPSTLRIGPETIFSAIKAYLSLSRDTDAWGWVDSLIQGHSKDPDAWVLASGVHMAIGDHKLGIALLEQAKDRIWSMPDVLNELVENYRSMGNSEGAIDLLKKSLSFDPMRTTPWLNLSNLEFQAKNWDGVIDAATQGLQVNPISGKLWLQRARALEMRARPGDVEDAVRCYQAALALPDADFDIGARVTALTKQPSLEDLRRKWPLDSLIADGGKWKEIQGRHAVILLSQRSLLVHPWGGVEQYLRQVVEVRSSKGVDMWKEENAWNYFLEGDVEISRAVTHKADGRTLEADINGTHVVFQGLEPGDRIEMEAKCTERKDGILAGHFWVWHLMAHSSPLLHSYFEIFAPSSTPYRVATPNWNGKAQQKKMGTLVQQYWQQDKTIGYSGEENMDTWNDVLPKVVVSSVPNWETISSWYAQLSEGKTDATTELKDLAAILFAGAQTDEEKILRVHELIERNIRYSHQPFRQSGFIPQTATKTWLTRIGDCKDMAVLGKALLKLAGIESQLVLVNTNDQERQAPLPMDLFNHCILFVRAAGGRYVDFTADQNGWKALPRSDQHALALRIDPNHLDTVFQIPFSTESEIMSRESWDTLCANGDLVRHVRSQRGGNFAADYRSDYGQETPERQKEITLLALQGGYPGVELFSLDVKGLDSLQQNLQYETHYVARRYAAPSGNLLTMSMPWSDQIVPRDLPGEGVRHYAWVAWKNWKFWGQYSQTVHLQIPAGYHPLTLPAPVKISGQFGNYEATVQQVGTSLEFTRSWKPALIEVTPAEYPKLRKELEAILQADQSSIVLAH